MKHYVYAVLDNGEAHQTVLIAERETPEKPFLVLQNIEVTPSVHAALVEFLQNASDLNETPTDDDWLTWWHEWSYDDTAEHTSNYYRDIGVRRG